ncbi:MAG: hypothetical protein KGI97_02970 [Alphaproteobacteria bacterium]|nr:hypothetical protein [Alphaproteobacteria bacterium]
MFVPAEVIKEASNALGLATGPAGFGMHYDVASGMNEHGAVELKLNDPSLTAAHKMNEQGGNKIFTALHGSRVPKPSGALAFMAQKQDKADNQYFALFARCGLDKTARRVMQRSPSSQAHPRSRPQARGHMRATLAREVSKNPLLRMRQRYFLQVRRTLDEVLKRKQVRINPEMLPEPVKKKMIETAIQNGQTNTPLGQIPPQMMKGGLAAAYKKWGGALIPGSIFTDLMPTKS